MALPLPSGLTPPEIAFLCEMELVTVVPRQRLEALHLLGGPLPPLQPPHRAPLPLWLALLLKRQRRANILPPPWLNPPSLTHILELETSSPSFSPAPSLPPPSPFPLSPPFLPTSTSSAPYDDTTSTISLPYHYLELSSLLLDVAADDIPDQDAVRRLLRDLREVRMAKIRGGVSVLEGGREVRMDGVGGLEVAEARAFVGGVVDGLRRIGASKEQVRREREAEEREMGAGEGEGEGEQEDGMDY